jgi:hypothetical protein
MAWQQGDFPRDDTELGPPRPQRARFRLSRSPWLYRSGHSHQSRADRCRVAAQVEIDGSAGQGIKNQNLLCAIGIQGGFDSQGDLELRPRGEPLPIAEGDAVGWQKCIGHVRPFSLSSVLPG